MDPAPAVLLAIGAIWLLTRSSGPAVAQLPAVLQTSKTGANVRYGIPGPAPDGFHWEPDKGQAFAERVVDPDGNSWLLIPDGF